MTRQRRSPISLDAKIDDYRQIMGYITQHGGYARDAMQALGLLVKLHDFRVFAKQQGFELKEYSLAWQRYGNWLTLPGPYKSEGKARYIVPAICLLCGNKYDLNLINAKSGKSTCCQTCKHKNSVVTPVLNETTGVIYRSMRSWIADLGMLKQYQQLRIKLRLKGRIQVNDQWYSLVRPTDAG